MNIFPSKILAKLVSEFKNHSFRESFSRFFLFAGSSNADLMSVNDVQNGNIVKKKKCKKKSQRKLVSGQILISPTIRKSSDQTLRPTSVSGVESTTSPADRSSNSAGILFSTSAHENRNWTKVHQKPHKIERKKSNTSTKSDPDQDKFKSSTSCIANFLHSTKNPFDVLTSASDRKRCSVDASRGFSWIAKKTFCNFFR